MSVIAVGGGKGGVGRTLVASGIAVFVAQLGKRVLLVDGHPNAPQLANAFQVVPIEGSHPPWVVPPIDLRGMETIVPGLRVLTANTELGAIASVSLRKPRQLAQTAKVDHTLLDLGAGIGTTVIDAMLDADVMVLVTTPEPVAVEAVYRFCRHVYARALARAFKGRPLELRALRGAIRTAGAPPEPVQLAEQIGRVSLHASETAWVTLARLRIQLVVNDSRSRADLDLGDAMVYVARQRLGVAIEYLGPVEYDDGVAAIARRRRPLLVDAPAAKASRHLERIARRLLSIETHRAERVPTAPAGPPDAPTHYEVLGLDRGASDEEIRRAYRRAREIYSRDSVAIAGLLNETATANCIARIEEARDVLLDPSRRRPYDLSITPPEVLSAWSPPPDPEPELQPAPPPEITPDTEFSGALLRAVREARGLELKDVASHTKISIPNLRAVENEEYNALPAPVYLRGFVAEMARLLRLDVEQVTRSYLRRYRRAMEASPRRSRS
jgi:flagellar biosynthesis protein FlhG